MKPDSASPVFVYLSFAEGEVLVNLHQIVQAHDISAEEVTLEMSNGKTIFVHGGETVARIVTLLSTYAIIPEGVPLCEFLSGKNTH
jgi:hypothetical protein